MNKEQSGSIQYANNSVTEKSLTEQSTTIKTLFVRSAVLIIYDIWAAARKKTSFYLLKAPLSSSSPPDALLYNHINYFTMRGLNQ